MDDKGHDDNDLMAPRLYLQIKYSLRILQLDLKSSIWVGYTSVFYGAAPRIDSWPNYTRLCSHYTYSLWE